MSRLVYLRFSLSFAIISCTTSRLPRIVTQPLARVTPVYRRFLLNRSLGPPKRGYNQAELLALEIGKQLGIRVENNWLIRTKNTVPQKLLNGQERQNNLKKAFKAGQNDVKLNAIVIIDDIYTTGSTIDAMAAVCRQQGVSRIYFAALSIGNGQEVR